MLLLAGLYIEAAYATLCSNWRTSDMCANSNDGGCKCLWRADTCEKGTECIGFGTTSIVDKKQCVLSDGSTQVDDSWAGNDVGQNSCNKCKCNDGALACTKMACQGSS